MPHNHRLRRYTFHYVAGRGASSGGGVARACAPAHTLNIHTARFNQIKIKLLVLHAMHRFISMCACVFFYSLVWLFLRSGRTALNCRRTASKPASQLASQLVGWHLITSALELMRASCGICGAKPQPIAAAKPRRTLELDTLLLMCVLYAICLI